jgi:hypothetical protein
MEASERPSAGYQVAVGVLVVLIFTAVALIISMAVRPTAGSAIADVSTTQQPSHCLHAAPGSVCFDNFVRNAGAVAATFLCDVSSTEAGQASFPPGTSSSTMVYLQPGNQVTVQSIVAPVGAATGIGPPLVTCSETKI